MSFLSYRENAIKLIKELFKHSNRDNCYDCKQLLKAMGLNPDKTFDETFKEVKP